MRARNAMGTAGVELAGRAEKKPLPQHPRRWSTTRNGEAARRRKTPPQGEAGCEVETPAREDKRELDAPPPEDWRKLEVLRERVNTKSTTVARKYERGQMAVRAGAT